MGGQVGKQAGRKERAIERYLKGRDSCEKVIDDTF